MQCHRFAELDGNSFENDIFLVLSGPVRQGSIESVTMRTKVAEKFDDFDFITGVGRLGNFQYLVIDVFWWIGRGRHSGCCHETDQHDSHPAGKKFDHVYCLTERVTVVLIPFCFNLFWALLTVLPLYGPKRTR